jgi:hypothetical protein
MLPPILWVPLDFFNDIIIRLSRLIRTVYPYSWFGPTVDGPTAIFPLAAVLGRPPCVELVVAMVCSGML